jgi:hypothetical protein
MNQTMSGASIWWLGSMSKHKPDITPREQYRGLGFSTLVKIQEQFPEVEEIKIVTGGTGLTDLDAKIVPYDFTASKNEEHNVYQHVTAEPFVQTVWWKMVNSGMGKGQSPIHDLAEEHPNDLILISCGKVFLRYIAEDILNIANSLRNNVRILLSASSVGSVPMQLRPMMIPYDRSIISHLIGNRNDSNHRAAQFFLNLAKEEPGFLDLPLEKQIPYFADGKGPNKDGLLVTQAAIEKTLSDNPSYLQMDSEACYRLVRREHGAFGGRGLFKQIFRKMGGKDHISQQLGAITVSDEDQDASMNALQGLSFLTETKSASAAPSVEEAALIGLKTFLAGLQKLAPQALFTASDVCQWAQKYYAAATTTTAPDNLPLLFKSPNKLVHTIKNNLDLLNLREVEVQSGKAYQLIPSL